MKIIRNESNLKELKKKRINKKENKFNTISEKTKINKGVKFYSFFDVKIQKEERNNSKELKNSKINTKNYKTQKTGIPKYYNNSNSNSILN